MNYAEQQAAFIAENSALDEAIRQRNNNVHKWIAEQRRILVDSNSKKELEGSNSGSENPT